MRRNSNSNANLPNNLPTNVPTNIPSNLPTSSQRNLSNSQINSTIQAASSAQNASGVGSSINTRLKTHVNATPTDSDLTVSPLPVKKPVLKGPSLPIPIPESTAGKSKDQHSRKHTRRLSDDSPDRKRECLKFIYNKEKNEYCGRTCKNWLYICAYSIVYMMFLATFTFIFLYITLYILQTNSIIIDKAHMLTFSENGIGLSATPTSGNTNSIIWYKNDDKKNYDQYINAIEKLLAKKRTKRDLPILTNDDDNEVNSLGPCGEYPFGYGDSPCVIFRINRVINWFGKPLQVNSSRLQGAPAEVKNWVKNDKKLWLHCSGLESYDKEHIGNIKYYPDPPGFDPDKFPLDKSNFSPLVGVQFSNFTLGISLTVRCTMWCEDNTSQINFILYVE